MTKVVNRWKWNLTKKVFWDTPIRSQIPIVISLNSCIYSKVITSDQNLDQILGAFFAKNLFEMIFAFLLLLQLVQYNVQGKHYLVETEDGHSVGENSPGEVY